MTHTFTMRSGGQKEMSWQHRSALVAGKVAKNTPTTIINGQTYANRSTITLQQLIDSRLSDD